MTDIITGTGEYKTRAGIKARVVHVENGWAFGFVSNTAYMWTTHGASFPYLDQITIISPWREPVEGWVYRPYLREEPNPYHKGAWAYVRETAPPADSKS